MTPAKLDPPNRSMPGPAGVRSSLVRPWAEEGLAARGEPEGGRRKKKKKKEEEEAEEEEEEA